MNTKFKLIFSGIALLGFLFWTFANNHDLIADSNWFILLYFVAFALIAIGLRMPKTYDKKSECPHCGSEGKNRDIFLPKGKDGKRLINQCLSCNGGVYLNWKRKKLPLRNRNKIAI